MPISLRDPARPNTREESHTRKTAEYDSSPFFSDEELQQIEFGGKPGKINRLISRGADVTSQLHPKSSALVTRLMTYAMLSHT